MKVFIMGAPTEKGFRSLGLSKTPSGGGWVEGLINELESVKDNIQLIVAFYSDLVKTVTFTELDGIEFVVLPLRRRKLDICTKAMTLDLNYAIQHTSPDVVHIIGTERPYDYELFKIVGVDRAVVSITGLTSICSEHYLAGIDWTEFVFPTIGDILRRGGVLQERRMFVKWGDTEKKLLSKAKYVMGRTTWDYACTWQLNPNREYYWCGEILNDLYYKNTWDVNRIDRHTIFVSQASYPLKGFHILLEALSIILQFYPDTKVYVAGNRIIANETLVDKLKMQSYGRYLRNLMKKLNIMLDRIVFTGVLDPKQMLNKYLSSNVAVIPSSIENSSNSLGEAMILGMPIVASYVGGIPDMMIHNKTGFLYPFDEPYMLAHYIMTIFKDDSLASSLGKGAQSIAKERFDRSRVKEITVDTYQRMINNIELLTK